jgi:hypothetical protein
MMVNLKKRHSFANHLQRLHAPKVWVKNFALRLKRCDRNTAANHLFYMKADEREKDERFFIEHSKSSILEVINASVIGSASAKESSSMCHKGMKRLKYWLSILYKLIDLENL